MIALLLNLFYTSSYVEGYSMQPTLNSTAPNIYTKWDTVYINKVRTYEINQIVVAKRNVNGKNKLIIKRLIGLEGDIIQIKEDNGHYNLLVNEELLYSKPIITESQNGQSGGSVDYYNSYLDYINRYKGTDRIVKNSLGEDCIKIYKNECFLMGDNWGETTDSLTYGPFNVSMLIGVVDIIIPNGESKFIGFIQGIWDILTS